MRRNRFAKQATLKIRLGQVTQIAIEGRDWSEREEDGLNVIASPFRGLRKDRPQDFKVCRSVLEFLMPTVAMGDRPWRL
jgi:hypothetical protein